MLPRQRLAHPSGATAELFPYGAHVASWVPAGGSEALFLSRASLFQSGKAIRGGIPVVFPQFADQGPLPKHGFARTREWKWIKLQDPASGLLELRDDAETRALWPCAFNARIRVRLDARRLTVELEVLNTGDQPWSFTAALHTYLRVADVRTCRVHGLQGVDFLDKVSGTRKTERERSWSVSAETDRVYVDAPPEVQIEDPGNGRGIVAHNEGFADVVVWNPWRDKVRALPDMQPDEYLEMLCVEAAQAARPVVLAPGAHWRGCQRLEVVAM